jgi:uncharacterized membrane protein YgdD (TMEM256/DUF423 family)
MESSGSPGSRSRDYRRLWSPWTKELRQRPEKAGKLVDGSALSGTSFFHSGIALKPGEVAQIADRFTRQLAHAIVMLIASRENGTAAHMFNVGMTMFSGSIYGLVLAPNLEFLGPVTPVGGLFMIGGWLSLAFGWGA